MTAVLFGADEDDATGAATGEMEVEMVVGTGAETGSRDRKSVV